MATAKKIVTKSAAKPAPANTPPKFALGTKVTWVNRQGRKLLGKTISTVEMRGASHWLSVRDSDGKETSVRPSQLTRV